VCFANERFERNKVRLDRFCKAFGEGLWHDKCDTGAPHFRKLCFRYAFLQSQQMLVWNPVCLIQDLPPTILTSCFDGQHSQPFSGKRWVFVGCCRWEQKIRLLAGLGFWLVGKVPSFDKPLLDKDGLGVKFQRIA
jgi:hypothetical protein